jgi:hypothetical protein
MEEWLSFRVLTASKVIKLGLKSLVESPTIVKPGT